MASYLKYKKAVPKEWFILPDVDPLKHDDPDQAANGIAYNIHYLGAAARYKCKLEYLDRNTEHRRNKQRHPDSVMAQLRERELFGKPDDHQEGENRKHGGMGKGIKGEQVPD